MRVRSRLGMLLVLLGSLLPAIAIGQGAGKSDELLLYQGPDRQARLLERAKKEGMLTLYTSLAPTESQPLSQAFEKKYGVKVELWRALSDQIVQRAVTETKAGRNAFDVIETNGPEMEMMAREKLFAEFFTPHAADLPPASIPKHRLWLPDRLNFYVVAYNTAKVRKDELPASYLGFADPRWKGRIGIEATDAEWMATLIKAWGAGPGTAFFRKLAELKPDIRKGHVLLAQMVATGEVPVGLTIYSGNAETMKRKGAPIEWAAIAPVAARPQGVGIGRSAPHPHAALLFVDFVLSPEGQKLFESMGRAPASTRVKSHLNDFNYVLIDPVTVLDEADKWNRLWDELFLKK